MDKENKRILKIVSQIDIMTISKWKNYTADDMVKEYLKPKEKILNLDECLRCINAAEPIYEIEEVKKVNERLLRLKFASLSDVIINRCWGKGGKAEFNGKLLHKIYGDHYKRMLKVMEEMGLIWRYNYYGVGGYSRTIELRDKNTTTIKTKDKDIIKYGVRLKEELAKSYNKRLSNRIAVRYKESLKRISLNKEEARDFVNIKYDGQCEMQIDNKMLTCSELEGYKAWRLARIENFYTNDEVRRDENGRIYHELTNLPKDLLPFTNIKYELDARNTHPCLFVHELAKYYKKELNIKDNSINDALELISKYTVKEEDVHLGLSPLVSELKKHIKIKLPKDVIEYILLVFNGLFWDINLKKYNVSERAEIKHDFFSSVYYSYNNSTVVRKEDNGYYTVAGEKTYAKDFRETYPNVWKVLGKIKKEGKKKAAVKQKELDELDYGIDNVRAKNNLLPNLLMKFESEIFTEILEKLLVHYDVINIHDAICVIDTENNKNLEPGEVERIMLDVFKKYHLYPTIKLNVPQNELME